MYNFASEVHFCVENFARLAFIWVIEDKTGKIARLKVEEKHNCSLFKANFSDFSGLNVRILPGLIWPAICPYT